MYPFSHQIFMDWLLGTTPVLDTKDIKKTQCMLSWSLAGKINT